MDKYKNKDDIMSSKLYHGDHNESKNKNMARRTTQKDYKYNKDYSENKGPNADNVRELYNVIYCRIRNTLAPIKEEGKTHIGKDIIVKEAEVEMVVEDITRTHLNTEGGSIIMCLDLPPIQGRGPITIIEGEKNTETIKTQVEDDLTLLMLI